MTEFPISALRSVDLEVPDLDGATAFYAEVWGLRETVRTPDACWLRATGDDHHVLALHRGDAPAIRSMTFRATDADALDRLADAVPHHGGTVLRPRAPLEEPGGGEALVIGDDVGRRYRIVHGDVRRRADPDTADRPSRLAHVNINSRDVDATQLFLEQALGFRLTDRSRLMSFVRTNHDHHSIVIAEGPVDTLNHVAFLMPSWEAVMRGSGRLVDAGHPIGWGVGRHGPGDNVFAYFLDPFGIVIEYTAEVQQVDDDHVVRMPHEWVWPPGRTDQWGIAPPKSDLVKQAQLAIPFSDRDA